MIVLATHAFEGAEVAVVEHKDQRIWSARQVSAALGYSEPNIIPQLVGREWSDDLEEGTDYMVLRGEELQAVKAAGLVGANAPSAMFLTESGVHLVALLSRQPASRALRRWLADEVLPSIRESGGYGRISTKDLRERRLLASAMLRAGDKLGARQVLRETAAALGCDVSGEAHTVSDDEWAPRVAEWIKGRKAVTLDEVLMHALDIPKAKVTRGLQQRAGRLMRSFGWERKRSPQVNGHRTWQFVAPVGLRLVGQGSNREEP